MKKIIIILLVAFATQASAQDKAFAQGEKLTGLGLGASQFFHIAPFYNDYYGYYGGLSYPTLTGELNIQSEKAVSDYIGVGMTMGIGGNSTRLYPYGEANLAIGALANFHFYQLIADKSGKKIGADKLDIYAGLNLGTGAAVQFYSNDVRLAILAFGGFQVGARYYVSPRIAFNLEAGYGKSLINGGITIKMPGKRKG